MKKVLFTAKVDSHIINFHIPYLKWFKDKGYEVHVASNGNEYIPYVDKKFNLPFDRNPFKATNIKSYNELKDIINKNEYELIHCHTPIAGVLTRLASKKARKNGTKVLYTVHGFHFYKGGSKLNWIIFYPIEKWLARYVDCIITINEHDYNLTKEKKFKCKDIRLVNGVGVDLERFNPINMESKDRLRKNLGYNKEDFILVYVAELNENKNQDMAIKAMNILKDIIPNIKLLLVGEGVSKEGYLREIDTLGLNDKVILLGHRKDVNDLLKLSDIAISTSKREGLPRNIMEAMATGVPIVVTNCRGNSDLIEDGSNGYIVDINDDKGLATRIKKIYDNPNISKDFGESSLKKVKLYELPKVLKDMEDIYISYVKNY